MTDTLPTSSDHKTTPEPKPKRVPKEKIVPRDLIGNLVKLQDIVCYVRYSVLKVGVVTKVNQKTVEIKPALAENWRTKGYTERVLLTKIVVCNSPAASIYLLKID